MDVKSEDWRLSHDKLKPILSICQKMTDILVNLMNMNNKNSNKNRHFGWKPPSEMVNARDIFLKFDENRVKLKVWVSMGLVSAIGRENHRGIDLVDGCFLRSLVDWMGVE